MNKRIKRTAVSRWMAMTAAALTLGACSQSEEAVEMLPEGKYPIELTATGLEPAVTPMTRATVDGNWDGVETVAVEVDGVVKEYSVDVSGSANKKEAVLKAGEGVDPFYWKSTADIKVSAWWPYSATKPDAVALVTEQNTKEAYQESDALEAVEQTVKYAAPTLAFKHRTAKMCVNVVNGSGDAMAVDGVEVSLGSNVVKPYKPADGTYLCLIPGGTATDANKLSVKITTIDGATYVYTHTSAYTFEANKQYTFTLTVNREGIQLNGCTISDWGEPVEVKGEAKQPGYTVDEQGVWHIQNADGLKAWADAVSVEVNGDISAILDNDIEMPAPGAGEISNWEPVGKKYEEQENAPDFRGTFDGNGHTISGLVVKSIEKEAGFFGRIHETVKNLTLKDATIEGVQNVGAVAGYNAGTIENCHVKSSLITTSATTDYTDINVGGIAGSGSDLYYCSVSADCTVQSRLTAKATSIGGLVGYSYGGNFQGCYAVCELDGKPRNNFMGGLIGYCRAEGTFKIYGCYANCRFYMSDNQEPDYVGGIAGAGYGIFNSNRQGQNISGVLWNVRSGNVTNNLGSCSSDQQLNGCIKKVSVWSVNELNMLNFGLGDKTQEYMWQITDEYQSPFDSPEPYKIVKKQQ